MRVGMWLLILALAALAGCSTSSDNSESTNIIIRTLTAGVSDTLTLQGGSEITFPAAAYDQQAIVIFADVLNGTDGTPAYFPAPATLASDLLSGLVVNTPADRVLGADLPLTFELHDYSAVSAVPGVSPGDQYAVYRFDPDNRIWNRWGFTYATVDNSGDFATTTLPTHGLRGYIGSVALFKTNDLGTLPAAQTTTIEGTVVNGSGTGVQTDVSLYVLVGANKYARALDDPDAFVPAIQDPENPNQNISVANAVMSAADGTFSIDLPDGLVGQLVDLGFGLADTSVNGTDRFDVLTPAIVDRATITNKTYLNVEAMRVQYGVNSVRSRAVQ